MATVQFRCSDDLEAKFLAAAKRAGVKPADLARAVFERAFGQSPLKAPPSNEGVGEADDDEAGRVYEPRSERLYARLTPSEYGAVEAKASGMGMTPYSWTARLIRAHLIKAPQLTHDETRSLREATRELSYVGRNLNQVAHALNMTVNAREKATVELIAEINTKVDVMRDSIKSVLDQNLNRWGV
jgi:hypothetical protein